MLHKRRDSKIRADGSPKPKYSRVRKMPTCNQLSNAKVYVPYLCAVLALALVGSLSPAKADDFEGPSFRKGLWHFVRTLDLVAHRKMRQRVLQREMTACVDPTVSMKATFASPSIGGCISARPEKVANKFIFANRCDYMGPVSTTITVNSDASYTEMNELNTGAHRVELVVAERLGDCEATPPMSDAISSAARH
jgi:hypothetical protein